MRQREPTTCGVTPPIGCEPAYWASCWSQPMLRARRVGSSRAYPLAGDLGRASKDLGTLKGAIDSVVKSMDKSTETMASLTHWLIAAAAVSAVAAIIQVVLFIAKKG